MKRGTSATPSPKTETYAELRLRAVQLQDTDAPGAYRLIATAASTGEPAALTDLATMLLWGIGTTADVPAAVSGHPPAQTKLAEHLLFSGPRTDTDRKRATALLTSAAGQKHPRAMNLLGVCYDQGLGVAPNASEAQRLISEAAALNDCEAMANVALRQIQSKDPAEHAKAVELLRRGSAAGCALCRARLAYCLEKDRGVSAPDRAEAQKLYQQAAEAGVPEAEDWCRRQSPPVPFPPRKPRLE